MRASLHSVTRLIIAILAMAAVSACGTDGKDKTMKLEDPVCGLISLRLIDQVSGDARLEPSYQKMSDPTNPKDFFYDCSVRNADTHRTFVQLRVSSVVSRDLSLRQVAQDKTGESGRIYAYSGDFGDGYGAETDESDELHPSGVHINVVRRAWQYDLVVYNWPEATPDERRKLVEQMVPDIEKNLDKASGRDSASTGSIEAPSAAPGHVNNRLSERLG